MQKETKSKKTARLLGAGAVLLLLGVTGHLLLSEKTLCQEPPSAGNERRTVEKPGDGDQDMPPEAAARINRLKSLAHGLKNTAARSDADQATDAEPRAETNNLLKTLTRLQVEKANGTDENSNIPETSTADHRVRNLSSRQALIEGLERLGTKENREQIRELLRQKRLQTAPKTETDIE